MSDAQNAIEASAIITLLLVAKHCAEHFFPAKKEGEKDSGVMDALGIAVAYANLSQGNALAHLILYALFGATRMLKTAAGHVEMLDPAANLGNYLAFASILAMALNGVIGVFD
ncbi:MAG: hypothetical protein SGCHY_000865 [Lobulomycetales sp.]